MTALAFATLAALVTYSQAHSQRLAVVTGTVAYLACIQMYREDADGVIDGLRWTFNKCAGGLVAAARWAFNMAEDVYVDCTEPDWLKEATKHLEAYAVSSSGDGAPVKEKANIFFENEAAPGRARRSAERGLPAASTMPQQALQAELAMTSPALPPINPGAPGYLGSSVSAEFPSLGSAFCVGGSGPGGDYLQDPATYYSHIAAAGEGPAQTEWVECGDGGSPGEPEGHAAVIGGAAHRHRRRRRDRRRVDQAGAARRRR